MKAKAYQCGRRRRWAAGASIAVVALITGASVGAEATTSLAAEVPSIPLAQSNSCPVKPVYPLPQRSEMLHALLEQLDLISQQCLLDASFHAWRGAVLLSLRRPAAAIESLERALLIDPSLPGAQLDYAQAMLAMGDKVSARDLLHQLSLRADLPPHLQLLLKEELIASDPSNWRSRWILTSALGYDSNLNNAPAASELTLTFPQGAITLPLADSFRPQSGAAWLNVAQWQGLKPLGAQLWLLQAELRTRHTVQRASRYQQADVSASWLQGPEAPRQWVARVGASRIDFGGQRLLESVRTSALHQWQMPSLLKAMPNCRPSLGAEAEFRRYPATPELDGRYAGIVASANCQATSSGDGVSWAGGKDGAALQSQLVSLQMRWGRERPANATRPGGTYDKLELRATWEGRHGPFKLNADYAYTRQSDSGGYSPLLSGNLARLTVRHSIRLEAALALPASFLGGPDWFVSTESSRQTSNLTAFASRQTALYSGLRWSAQ